MVMQYAEQRYRRTKIVLGTDCGTNYKRVKHFISKTMTDFPKPLSKAEVKALEKKSENIGKVAPQYTSIQCGSDIRYHEAQRIGYGAILQPTTHSKYFHLNMFSFKVTGTKCEILHCEYDYVHATEVNDYLQGAKEGVKALPTQEIMDVIEEYLASKGIGITF